MGVASQSGALQTAMFIRAFDAGIGLSSAITVGNQADLELSDGFDYLVDDPETRAILLYLEGLNYHTASLTGFYRAFVGLC